jgi:hypothetical protein
MKKKPADYSNIMSKLFSNGLPLVAPYVSNTSQKSSSKKYSLQNLSPSISQKSADGLCRPAECVFRRGAFSHGVLKEIHIPHVYYITAFRPTGVQAGTIDWPTKSRLFCAVRHIVLREKYELRGLAESPCSLDRRTGRSSSGILGRLFVRK